MRVNNDIPWWSSKWFAFVIVMIFSVLILTFWPKNLTKSYIFFCISVNTVFLYEGWQHLFLLKPRGRIYFLVGLAFVIFLTISLFLWEVNAILYIIIPQIAFGFLEWASEHTYRNRLDWYLWVSNLIGPLPMVCYSERFFLGPNSVISIPVKQTKIGDKYIVLSEFNSWPTKSKTIKEGRRDVIIERLKEFCFREGIQVVESEIE